jgi:predicted hydrocarbon binding protein
MVTITNKPEHDPVADMMIVDAYMRWAIEAARKIIGEDALESVLHDAKLDRFIDHPPSGEMIATDVTFGDYANFNAALLNQFQLYGKKVVKDVGQESAQMALTFQRSLFNMATVTAAKLFPTPVQLKVGLSAMMAGFRTLYKQRAGETFEGRVEDRGEHFAFVVETCPFCAGKQSESCIGWLWEAVIEESGRQTWGKFFDVVETECRAKGDPAGVWLIPKHPGDEAHNESAP